MSISLFQSSLQEVSLPFLHIQEVLASLDLFACKVAGDISLDCIYKLATISTFAMSEMLEGHLVQVLFARLRKCFQLKAAANSSRGIPCLHVGKKMCTAGACWMILPCSLQLADNLL